MRISTAIASALVLGLVACTPAFDRPRPGGHDARAEQPRAPDLPAREGPSLIDLRLCEPRPNATVVFGTGGACGWICSDGWYNCDGKMDAAGCERQTPCTPETVELQTRCATALALDESNVYWFSEDAILSASKAAPTERRIVAQAKEGTEPIVVDGTHVYWGVTRDPGGIWRAAKGGVPVGQLAPAAEAFETLDRPRALAIDDGNLYWVSDAGSSQTIARRSKTVGGAVTMVTGRQRVWAFALDVQHLYWTAGASSDSHPTAIERRIKTVAGATSGEPVAGQPSVVDLALSSSYLFWLSRGGSVLPPAVLRSLKAAPALPESIVSGIKEPTHLAIDDHFVYWTSTGEGKVYKIRRVAQNLTAAAAILVASGQPHPWAIAVDDTHVYWTNTPGADQKSPGGCNPSTAGKGNLLRVPK